jgi:hypothetical protein
VKTIAIPGRTGLLHVTSSAGPASSPTATESVHAEWSDVGGVRRRDRPVRDATSVLRWTVPLETVPQYLRASVVREMDDAVERGQPYANDLYRE